MRKIPYGIVVLAATLAAQGKQIAWQSDYDAALKQAMAEKKPLFIVFLMDNESANDSVAQSHLHDQDLVELSRSFVCLIACAGSHGDAATCPKFGVVSCAQHLKIEMRARSEFMNSPRIAAPQFLVIAPDGKTVILRHVYLLAASELEKKLRVALGALDPSKGGDAFAEVRKDADDLLKLANDNNAVTRQAAVQGLAASADPRVGAFLIRQTAESVDEARRLEAIEAMGQRGNGLVLPVLHKLLESKSNQIRIAVAKSIENLGMPDSAPALLAALKRENKSMVRGHLARALVACDAVTPDHRKVIVGMIKGTSQADRLNGLRASSSLSLDGDLKKALLDAMKDNNPSVRGASWWVLGIHKVAEAGEHLSKAVLNEKNPDTRNLGLDAISKITGAAYEGPDPDSCLSNLFMTSGLVW